MRIKGCHWTVLMLKADMIRQQNLEAVALTHKASMRGLEIAWANVGLDWIA